MKWLTVAVEAKFGWPTEETEIEYLGCKYILKPESDEDSQSVSLLCPAGSDMNAGRLLVSRFLSALSWAEGKGIAELFAVGSSAGPSRVGVANTRFVAPKFKADYLPEPTDDRSLLALALFREAQSINNAPYAFLGFFKVLNILFRTGNDQKAWINSNINSIQDYSASKRLLKLQDLHEDLGEYLYVQGRCAVAHAFNDPVADPDKPEDIQRLSEDLSVIKELAAIAIESELGIIGKSTYHKLHLYELDGFEKILGKDITETLKKGGIISEERDVDVPRLSVRLRDHQPFESYENLNVVHIQQYDKSLIMRLHSDDDIIQMIIVLDFGEWRLVFDPLQHVSIHDDASPKPMHAQSDTALFAKGKYLNGQVEIYNSETNERLARTDPFIPVNVDLRSTAKNLEEISKKALSDAEERSKKDINQSTYSVGSE